MIPHSKPSLDEKDAQAVGKVILSGMIAQGEQVGRFENEVAKRIGVKGGVATSSGTAALHLALLALGVGRDDEVIIPGYVCAALLNAVRYVGAQVILADVNPSTYNTDPRDVRKKMTERTRAIIVPHMFGLPADIDEITSLGVPVIEDCALSLGATYKGKPVGAFGEMAVFSFYATKVITTGEGGMVLSNDKSLLDRARDGRDYDCRDDEKLRFNYKMTDMQAALGLSQLEKLEQFILERRRIAHEYSNAFGSLGLILPEEDDLRSHIYHRYVIEPKDCATDTASFIDACQVRGVCCRRPIFRPLNYYLGTGSLCNTEVAWQQAISVPIFPSLGQDEVKRVIEVIVDTV